MAETATNVARRLQDGLERVVAGNEQTIFALLVALLAGGHILLEGVPGTAKTLFVRVLARLLGLDFRRIAFTPDLMPSDVVGTTVFDPRSATFAVRRGPVFTNLLLADEINRTPPKTQSALLEAMEERQVTIDGDPYALPTPFMLCATQNPIDYEGTYSLPEAQLDRFLIRSSTAYPTAVQERALIARWVAGFDAHDLDAAGVTAVAEGADVVAAQRDVRSIFVAASLQDYIYAIIAATRAAPDLVLGASPRAALGLVQATQAAAAIEGRAFATPDDVKSVVRLVLEHRLIVRPEAELEAVDAAAVMQRILAAVATPHE